MNYVMFRNHTSRHTNSASFLSLLPEKASDSEFNKPRLQRLLRRLFFFFLGPFVGSRIQRISSHVLACLKPCFPEGVRNAPCVKLILQILHSTYINREKNNAARVNKVLRFRQASEKWASEATICSHTFVPQVEA